MASKRDPAVSSSLLISLMNDQVCSLASKRIKAAFVTMETMKDCDSSVEQHLHEGAYQIVFFTPEAFLCNNIWREMLRSAIYQVKV